MHIFHSLATLAALVPLTTAFSVSLYTSSDCSGPAVKYNYSNLANTCTLIGYGDSRALSYILSDPSDNCASKTIEYEYVQLFDNDACSLDDDVGGGCGNVTTCQVTTDSEGSQEAAGWIGGFTGFYVVY